jgi:hypothetical protein
MKATILLLVLLVTASFCFGIVQFSLGADLAGNHHTNLKYEFQETGLEDGTQFNDYSVAMGISPSIEYMLRHEGFLYGFGAEYQVQRDGKFSDGKNKFGFIPLFGVVRYQFASSVGINPELIGQAGYNFFTADDNYKKDNYGEESTLHGGIYWGIGAGLVIKHNYLLQIMYKTNYGKATGDGATEDTEQHIYDYDMKVTNSQINISFGYRM